MKVLYMSENRSLAVLEVLVHLTDTLPDKYVIGSAEIPDDLAMDVPDVELGDSWETSVHEEHALTRRIGDAWVRSRHSAALREDTRTSREFIFSIPSRSNLTPDCCGPLCLSARKSHPSETK